MDITQNPITSGSVQNWRRHSNAQISGCTPIGKCHAAESRTTGLPLDISPQLGGNSPSLGKRCKPSPTPFPTNVHADLDRITVADQSKVTPISLFFRMTFQSSNVVQHRAAKREQNRMLRLRTMRFYTNSILSTDRLKKRTQTCAAVRGTNCYVQFQKQSHKCQF